MSSPPRTHYFAYGSNLWLAQMTQRCPQSTLIGTGLLPSHRWFIYSRGYANIRPSAPDECYGIVYSITDADMALLDRYEGAPYIYERVVRDVQMLDDGRVLPCVVYIDPIVEEGVVKEEYIKRINNGLEDAREIPERWVERYVRPYVPAAA
ncbi:uncharacterized protein H6S33_006454 [Morchella sextelata]|jgi:gamma-glutamylcyclotransferase|uniref:uncharacterized protein n=1 Tax=Morchella sextelata TaxID=1174677 RepID=UPI001D037A97|nr:uncharacterized protein H6S33_006454 [Morchella sextelata]KAH0604786.1 hypothetical protein H6S33_006454 [Morchella sextelata]